MPTSFDLYLPSTWKWRAFGCRYSTDYYSGIQDYADILISLPSSKCFQWTEITWNLFEPRMKNSPESVSNVCDIFSSSVWASEQWAFNQSVYYKMNAMNGILNVKCKLQLKQTISSLGVKEEWQKRIDSICCDNRKTYYWFWNLHYIKKACCMLPLQY